MASAPCPREYLGGSGGSAPKPLPLPAMNLRLRIAFACLALLHAGTSAAAGDAAAGKALYQSRCAACHALDFNGVGPAHRGVFGRRAAQAPGFEYSEALKASGIVWDDATLERWLADPERVAPGQRMGVSVPDARERSDLIAYLKQATAAPK